MPPTLRLTCVLRPAIRPSHNLRPIIGIKRRAASSTNQPDTLPQAPKGQPGPNTQQQEHVSEEAAKMAKIQGKDGPDLDAGTPVQEILAEEKDVRATAPEVLKEQMKKDPEGGKENARPNLNPQGIRSFSTMARRRLEVHSAASQTSAMDAAMLYPTSTSTAQTPITTPTQQPGHKFPLPELPLPPTAHKEYRHDPIVTQLTNLLMRDGKKSVAERNMAVILSTLRTTPAPTYSPQRTLLPGAPPASHLPLNPVLYLTLAVDSVAPLLRIRSQRGAAGGGVALQIPVPLALRQRRRQAFSWILDAASKRQNRGSGNHTFPGRGGRR